MTFKPSIAICLNSDGQYAHCVTWARDITQLVKWLSDTHEDVNLDSYQPHKKSGVVELRAKQAEARRSLGFAGHKL